MAYDDIASSPQNPFPGKVFNKPNGNDVYEGVQIDYSHGDCSADNFYAVLRGDSTATGGKRVLQSTTKSKVFVFYSDHGSPGLLAMPVGTVYADKLNQTINIMKDKGLFGELVLYIEACHSGSMFENILATNTKVYGTTASNPHESSWGCYCHPEDVVNGTHIRSCLGDLYSVSWIETAEAEDLTK